MRLPTAAAEPPLTWVEVTVGSIPERAHERIGFLLHRRRTGGLRKAMANDAVGRVADRLFAQPLQIALFRDRVEGAGETVHRLACEIRLRRARVQRPRVVHRRRDVEQVACVHGRSCEVLADGVQQHFVPLASHGRRARVCRLHRRWGAAVVAAASPTTAGRQYNESSHDRAEPDRCVPAAVERRLVADVYA